MEIDKRLADATRAGTIMPEEVFSIDLEAHNIAHNHIDVSGKPEDSPYYRSSCEEVLHVVIKGKHVRCLAA